MDGLGEQCQALARSAESQVLSGERLAGLVRGLRADVNARPTTEQVLETTGDIRRALAAAEASARGRSEALSGRVGRLEQRQDDFDSADEERRNSASES